MQFRWLIMVRSHWCIHMIDHFSKWGFNEDHVGTIYAFSFVLRWSLSLFFSCYFLFGNLTCQVCFLLSVNSNVFPPNSFFSPFCGLFIMPMIIKHSAIWVKTMIANVYCEAYVFIRYWSLSYLFIPFAHENLPTDTMLTSGPNARPSSDRLRK